MESMLNKLRSSVSNAATSAVSNAVQIASQVSGYLPGNPVTREFEATAHIASAGPGLVWKVYKGYKKSTKQDAAIFVFEKRLLDKWDKQEREIMLDKLRKGVSQLTRLRHPQVLTVQHPLEESRDTLAFATEPVFASLANCLGYTENMPVPPPPSLKNYKFYDVEIKYGLMQISEGLAFLHNSVKTVHRNICLENIVLNHQGAWKLFGFDFCVTNQAAADQPPFWPFEEYDARRHPNCQPHLDYLAPEYALTHTLDTAADLFPVGVIISALFNEGRPIFHNNQDFVTFKRNCCELKNTNTLKLTSIPEGIREEVRLLLHATPQLRPDAIQFSKIPYFEDVGVKTLSYLDQMFQWDNMQKSQFYKSLPQVIPQLPHRVCLLRIVSCLMKECINTTMVPFVLPVILLVAERATKEEYVEHIMPHLKPLMKLSEPVQIMLQLMQKMELLLGKTPAEDVRSDVLPLLYRALECNTQQIQELCLSVIPSCAQLVENHAMKNALIPKIKKLCLGTGYLSVRVNCLVCVGKILEHLDKWLVMDDIFPFLEQIPSRESPVIMAIIGEGKYPILKNGCLHQEQNEGECLIDDDRERGTVMVHGTSFLSDTFSTAVKGIFKVALHHKNLGITKEILAMKVLPFMFPLSIENSLTPNQHLAIMALIKEMTEKVEVEHRTKLEQLNSIKDEQKALQMAMPTNISGSSSTSNGSVVSAVDATMDMFSGMEVNQFTGGGSNQNSHMSMPSPSTKPAVATTTTTSLTLEDKQRMVKEQGLQDSVRKQPPLLPSPPPPSSSIMKSAVTQSSHSHHASTTPVSQNLTSSLINSNLNMMTSQSGQSNSTSRNIQQGVPATVGNSSVSPNIMNNINNSNMNYGGRPVDASGMVSSGNVFQPVGTNSWANQVPSQGVRMQTSNLSAFDSLLPSQPRPMSMNQMMHTSVVNSTVNPCMMAPNSMNAFGSMMSPMQSMSTSSFSAVSNSEVKPLSSSDINDLLS